MKITDDLLHRYFGHVPGPLMFFKRMKAILKLYFATSLPHPLTT
ncbi:MAG: hypothetical protein ABIJ04_03580 [Bacteroidota bacterium]